MLLLLYVDDTFIFIINQAIMNTLKEELYFMYKITEVGTLKPFLSIKLEFGLNEIRLH
jgi:hypothetical protein